MSCQSHIQNRGCKWNSLLKKTREPISHCMNMKCPQNRQLIVNVIYASWATFTGWKMGASLRIYSMASLPLGLGVEAAPNYTSRTYASMTLKHATLKLSHGKPLQTAEPHGSSKCHNTWKEGRLPSEEKTMKDGPGEQPVNRRTTQTYYIRHLSSHARAAAEVANPGLGFAAHKTMLINDLSWCCSIVDWQMDDNSIVNKLYKKLITSNNQRSSQGKNHWAG